MNAEPQIFLKNFGLRYLHYSCSIWESWLKNISFLLKILWHLPKLPSYTRCSHHGWQSTLCIHILLCKRLLSLNSWCPLKSLSDSRKRSISIVPCPSIPPPPPPFFYLYCKQHLKLLAVLLIEKVEFDRWDCVSSNSDVMNFCCFMCTVNQSPHCKLHCIFTLWVSGT